MKLAERLREYSMGGGGEEMTFEEYLHRFEENPRKYYRYAHTYIYDMIVSHGVKERRLPNGKTVKVYNFFDRELWGIEESVEEIMEYFRGAALGSDLHRRILFLVGPPGSGKSTTVIMLKRGLEAYSRTDEGAVYAIKGCPIYENPMHLIPREMRPEIKEQYGVDIEGDLCPVCQYRLKEEYGGDFLSVPVQRFYFSEQERIGIGTFLAGDPLTQDMTSIVGTVNLALLPKYGSETHPLVYDFRSGEAFVANRGLLEMVEGLKAKLEILFSLLTISQEKQVKTERFPLIYVDEVIVIHSNVEEFEKFLAQKEHQALKDRFYTIKVPYNLRYSEEERIYHKLITSTSTQDYHFAPYVFRVSAMFAILSRLVESDNLTIRLIDKMKLYNGDPVEGYTEKEVEQLQREGKEKNEGMFGLSPRFIVNALSAALARKEVKCLHPIDAFRALRIAVEKRPDMDAKQKERLISLLQEILKEYNQLARTDIQKAFYMSFEDEIEALFNTYIDNVEAYLSNSRLRDPVTGEEMEPDEKLMRSIEEKAGIPESAKKEFRYEIVQRVAAALRRGKKFDVNTVQKLKEGLEKQLFDERAPVIRATLTSRSLSEEELKKRDQVVATLIDRYGYCKHCALETMKYVSNLLMKE